MRRRKFRIGSMQLSIEAIIILVIAIVLLGLGIAFIKNFFGKGSNALVGTFDTALERCDVSADNTVLPLDNQVKLGDVSSGKLCVFNDQDADIADGKFQVIGCIGPGITTANPNIIKINSLDQKIQRGESAGYKVTFEAFAPATPGNDYICNVQVKGSSATSKVVGPVQMTFKVS